MTRNLVILTASLLVTASYVDESPAQGLRGTIPYYRSRTLAQPTRNRVNFRYGLPSSYRLGPSTYAVSPARSNSSIYYKSVVRYGPQPFSGLDASRDLYTSSPTYYPTSTTSESYIQPSARVQREHLRWRYGQDDYWYGRTSY